MNDIDPVSAILRGAHIAALASVFGTLVFAAVVIRTPPDTSAAQAVQRRLAVLCRGSLLLALALGLAWFMSRAAAVAGAHGWRETLAALPPVALETRFGRLVLIRLALLLALVPLCSAWLMRWPVHHVTGMAAIILAGSALALQAGTGHIGAMDGLAGQGLMTAEALHILAASAWLGALVPLLIVLVTTPPAAALALRRFFPLGLVAVLLVMATSVVQALALLGGVPALVGTPYGRLAMLKVLLFMALLALAALNRLVFSARPGARLRASIMGETMLAAVMMLTAAALSHLTPAAHDRATWPFPWRLNPSAAGRLLVPAYPTSFFVSPTEFAAEAIMRGEALYQARCATCHGTSAQGDGPAARTLPVAPADLTAARVLAYGDGDLFWLAGHSGHVAEEDQWDLVDYLRARNRGEFIRTAGKGVHSVRIPWFSAICADGRVIEPGRLRGEVLRLVGPPGPILPAATVTTVVLVADTPAVLQEASCVAQPEARQALAILLGTTSDLVADSVLLIDPNGWLRARWRPGDPGGWPSSELLLARIRALADHPLPAGPVSETGHRH